MIIESGRGKRGVGIGWHGFVLRASQYMALHICKLFTIDEGFASDWSDDSIVLISADCISVNV